LNKYAEHIKNLMMIEGAKVADGFDDAIIGYTKNSNSEYVIVYSASKIIDILIDVDGMIEEEAWQYFDFNIEGAYVGPRTPIFVFEEKRYTSFADDSKQQELPLSEEPDMWLHHCIKEQSDMAIGKGEPCNWCGEEEK